MIHCSKLVKTGLVVIAALGVIGGLIFRHDFLEKIADGASSGSSERKHIDAKITKRGTGNPIPKKSEKSVAGEKIPDELTPAQASQLFEEFKSKHPGNRERSDYAYAMMKQLCELGYTQEAWDLIEKDQGNVRINQLSAFFANAKLSHDELLGKISGSHGIEINFGINGFMSRFQPEQYEEILGSSDFKKFLGGLDSLNPKDAKIFKSNISSGVDLAITKFMFDIPDKTNDFLKIAASLNSQGILDTTRFMDMMARFGRTDPFGSWGLVSAIKPEGVDSGVIGEDRNSMIIDMLGADAPKALSKVLDNGNPAKATDINSAIGAWVNLDSREATDWFQQNRATLNPQDSDSIAAAFSTYAADLSEFSGAQQWAGQIRDPKLKAEVFQKIAEVTAAKEKRANETR